MVVSVFYDDFEEQWVVEQGSGGLFARFSTVSTHSTKSSAISKAKRVARADERITVDGKGFGHKTLREGSF